MQRPIVNTPLHRRREQMKKLYVLAALALAGATAVTALVGVSSAAPAKKPNIVWLELGAGNPYWDAQHKAAAEAGRRLGFDFKAVSGNLNPSTQSSILRQLADQHVTVVMLNPVDPKALVPAIKYAQSKGVPVLTLYGVNPPAKASITVDEVRDGRVAAINALGLLKQRYGKAEGTIGILHGILGQPASDLRANGFKDYLKKFPGVK